MREAAAPASSSRATDSDSRRIGTSDGSGGRSVRFTAARSAPSRMWSAVASPKFQEECAAAPAASTQCSVPPRSTTTSPARCSPTSSGTPCRTHHSCGGSHWPSVS